MQTMTWMAPGGGVDINVYATIKELRHKYDFSVGVGNTIVHNEFEDLPEIPIHQCPHLGREIRLWKDIRSIYFFYRLFKKEKTDIVYTHEAKASVITRVAAWLAGVPVIIFGLEGVTFNDPMSEAKRKFYIYVEKLTIWMNDFIVPVGSDAIYHYHKNGLGNRIPYQIIRSGIDETKFVLSNAAEVRRVRRRQLGIADDEVLLTMVGRFAVGKNHRELLAILAEVLPHAPHTKMLFVGDGEEMENCKQLAHRLGISEKVVFYGHSTEVPEWLYASDIFVFASLREGLPRVVVEAGYTRLPVICYEVEGARELITDGESGFIVEKGNRPQYLEKLLLLIQNPALRLQFGTKLLEWVAQEYTKERMIANLDELFSRLAAGIKK